MSTKSVSVTSLKVATAPSQQTHSRRGSTGHLCTACDQCYRCKVQCTGEKPTCERCHMKGSACTYSTGKPLGKPKGSKNRVQRSKTTPDQLPSQAMVPASDQKRMLHSPHSAKRPSDGSLPQTKRIMSNSPATELAPSFATLRSPKYNAPDLHSFPPAPFPSSETMSLAQDLAYYADSGYHDEQRLPSILEHPAPGRLENGYPVVGLNLEIEDYRWFTPQSEQFIAATPTTVVEVPSHTSPVSRDSTTYSSRVTMPRGPAHVHMESSPLSPPAHNPRLHQTCLCDPLSLGIISELHTLQLNLSPLDTALLLARRGLTTVSSYLTCPSCLHRLGNSPSLFLACVLILQQVFACYIALRMQGTRMLTSFAQDRKRADTPMSNATICIGDFEVEGDESRNVLLDAIVRSEIERGKGLIGTMEQWAEKVGNGKDRIAGVLLQSLKEEIGGVC